MPLIRPAAASLTLALALFALSGCKQEATKTEAKTSASASATPSTFKADVSGGRLILPAVKGNPGAAYFTVRNETTGTMAITAIAVDGAGKAEMHQTMGGEMTPVDRIDIAPGTAVTFEPGKLHVMLFDLAADKLKPAAAATMTLTFANGDKLSAPLEIEAMGAGAAHDMGDMH
ncbi:MAG: copper chaperone PCu(A)C [Sphingomonadales bacterium]|nr:copper chaperone PCu(A)C [Sphingomonadales bacterium]